MFALTRSFHLAPLLSSPRGKTGVYHHNIMSNMPIVCFSLIFLFFIWIFDNRARMFSSHSQARKADKLLILQLSYIQKMGPKKMTKALRTKSAAKKRFRVTGSGHIKCWPSRLHGRPLIIRKLGLKKTGLHLVNLLPNSKFQSKHKSTFKSRYLIEDREFDGI